MFGCQELYAAYTQGERRVDVLSDVSFEVDGGSTAITGPSGSGKSTLLRILAGLQKAERGRIVTPHGSVDARHGHGGRRGVVLIHQDYRLVPFLTVGENVQLAGELAAGQSFSDAQVRERLASVGLARFSSRMPGTLSGGEQQRVAIARALAAGADVLLADEPTGALDADNSVAVAELLRDIATSGAVTVVVATHDEDVYSRMAGRLELHAGTVRPPSC